MTKHIKYLTKGNTAKNLFSNNISRYFLAFLMLTSSISTAFASGDGGFLDGSNGAIDGILTALIKWVDTTLAPVMLFVVFVALFFCLGNQQYLTMYLKALKWIAIAFLGIHCIWLFVKTLSWVADKITSSRDAAVMIEPIIQLAASLF